MPTDPPSKAQPEATTRLRLGTTAALPQPIVEALAGHGIDVTPISEDADPTADIDAVLVVQPPSPLIGRCRGRWPVVAVVDDPRATDVSRLLRAGAVDVVRRPLRAADIADRVRRAVAKHRDPTSE